MTDTVQRAAFEAVVARLEQADANTLVLLNTYVAEHRRELGDVRSELAKANIKLDTVLTNQNKWQGRDGVILVVIGMAASVLTAVITAMILQGAI